MVNTMALPFLTWINGITAVLNFSIALFMMGYFLVQYFNTKKNLQPWVALLSFSLAVTYSGPSTTFLKLLITGENLEPIQLYYISYWLVPFTCISVIWIGLTIFYEKWRKPVIIFYLITAVGYYIAFLGFPSIMFETPTPVDIYNSNGEILDITLIHMIRVMIVFYMISMVSLLIGGFYRLLRKVEKDNPYRQKMIEQIIAWLIFVVGGTIETITPVHIAVIGRVAVTIFLILIFLSFRETKGE